MKERAPTRAIAAIVLLGVALVPLHATATAGTVRRGGHGERRYRPQLPPHASRRRQSCRAIPTPPSISMASIICTTSWRIRGRARSSFSFVHVTSPDMLHWTWQTDETAALLHRPRHVQRHRVSSPRKASRPPSTTARPRAGTRSPSPRTDNSPPGRSPIPSRCATPTARRRKSATGIPTASSSATPTTPSPAAKIRRCSSRRT